MRVLVVLPIVQGGFDEAEARTLSSHARSDTEVICTHMESGPESIETYYDEVFAVPGLVRKVQEAEEEGFDGVLISCFADVGLDAAREVASIPVVGVGQVSMLAASAVARKFSVITVGEGLIQIVTDNARKWGLGGLVSVRNIGVPVLELHDEARVKTALRQEAESAIEEDGAEAIVLGCTGIIDAWGKLSAELQDRYGVYVPVIDPAIIGLRVLEAFVELGLMQSKLRYQIPSRKRRVL